MLNDEIKKKDKKKYLSQLGLTYQIRDPGYKIKIITQKANREKLQNLIFN